jgi:glycosyltransferase involved in cell wall biosynthesis
MKVIHVLNSYLPNHVAGTEVYVSALVRELKKRDIESKIIIPNYGNAFDENYFFEDIMIFKYAEPTLADRDVIIGNKAPKGLANFIAFLQNEQPDIIHFHELAGSIGIGLFHLEAVKSARFKSIMTFHLAKYTCKTGTLMYMNEIKCDGVIRELECSKCWLNDIGEKGLSFSLIKNAYTLLHYLDFDARFLKNRIGTALSFPKIITEVRKNILKIEKNTHRFIILTEWYKNILLRNGISESHLSIITQGLPNVDVQRVVSKNSSNKVRLVFIGRINHFKGLDLLLNALKEISTESFSLDIYGAVSDTQYVKDCFKITEGLSNIFWKGCIPPSLVIETLKSYDLLCIPSSVSEMGPFVLKEAFAAGIPVLGSNVYGNADHIIDGANGWLFKFKNLCDLKSKLEYLISNRELIEHAKQNLPTIKSFETVAEEHERLYKELTEFIL